MQKFNEVDEFCSRRPTHDILQNKSMHLQTVPRPQSVGAENKESHQELRNPPFYIVDLHKHETNIYDLKLDVDVSSCPETC